MSTSNEPQVSSPPASSQQPSSSATDVVTPTRRRAELGRRLAIGDAFVMAVASACAYLLRDYLGRVTAVQTLDDEIIVAISVIPFWLLLFYLAGAYRPEYLNTGGDAFRRFVAGVAGGVFGIGFISFLLNLQLARLFVAFLAVFVFLGGGVLRMGMRSYLRRRHARGDMIQRTLVVGTDADAQQLAASLNAASDSAYEVVGYLDEGGRPHAPVDGVEVVGDPSDVLERCREHNVGVVIVSPAGVSPGTLRDLTIALEGSEVDLAVAPSLFQVVTRRMTIETVGGVPILHVDQIRLERGKAVLKRTVDVVAAVSLLVVVVPLLVVAGIAIRADSKGPVLFRQRRVGRDGREFTMLKLRTMVVDAEEQLAAISHLNEADGRFFKVADDPRVTRVGRHLRRWSIDELPQFVNVLRGDMSMVGPRPPLPAEVADYEAWHLRRLRVRPGVTGVWQVSGRSDVPFDEAVRLDLFYIENWSLGYDLWLLWRTIGAVLSRRGAF